MSHFTFFLILAVLSGIPTNVYNQIPSNCFKYCTCDLNQLKCINFNSFTDLDFSTNKTNTTFNSISFTPNLKIKLDNSFNLTGLTLSSNNEIELSNIESFSLELDPFKPLTIASSSRIFKLKIKDSNFHFLHENGSSINDHCDHSNQVKSVKIFEFASFLTLQDILFIEPICPIIFRNKAKPSLSRLIVINPSAESFHPFKFYKMLNYDNDKNLLNSSITNLELNSMTLNELDDIETLNYDVFSAVVTITITNAKILKIKSNTFAKLKALTQLKLNLLNWSQLEDFKWITSLNTNRNFSLKELDNFVNLPSKVLVEKLKLKLLLYFDLTLDVTTYTFPDGDFCLFKDFPHQQMVIPIVKFKPNANITCTCTLLWVYKYAKTYADYISDLSTSSLYTECVRKNYTEMIVDCKFEQRLEVCNSLTTTDQSQFTNSSQSTDIESSYSTEAIVISKAGSSPMRMFITSSNCKFNLASLIIITNLVICKVFWS